MAGVNGVAVGAVGAGLLFVWSGLKGGSVLRAFQALVSGQQPTGANVHPVATPSGGSSGDSGGPVASAIGAGAAAGGTVAANQAIAKQLAASYGWSTGTQWADLVKLWTRESGWRNTAENPSSGAYGIPQALPPTKMPKAARPPKLGGTSNAGAQISWGLSYIKGRYGSPSAAWAHEQSAGWY